MVLGGHFISASEMDSRLPSLGPSADSEVFDIMQRLGARCPALATIGHGSAPAGARAEWLARRRRYPVIATFGYGRTPAPAPAADGLDTPFENRVWEYFGEHRNVIRVDFGDDPYGRGRFGAVPASEAEIARLPVATAAEVKDCGVCLESFEEGEQLKKMTCPSSHGFHEDCISKWLRVSRLCPLCRFALPAEHEGHTE